MTARKLGLRIRVVSWFWLLLTAPKDHVQILKCHVELIKFFRRLSTYEFKFCPGLRREIIIVVHHELAGKLHIELHRLFFLDDNFRLGSLRVNWSSANFWLWILAEKILKPCELFFLELLQFALIFLKVKVVVFFGRLFNWSLNRRILL